ncbi:hypothetical protein V6N11_007552 [Hibiscus sabdariffa]|uniref:PCI domain-containing protein n=1 Tax=Hibiscus sabdariffa TaxID=183260 RepID=A0ABR2NSL8_9ROSI
MADGDDNQDQKPSKRPVITPPPRPFTEAFFNGGPGFMAFSPGPMTLVSNYFSATDDFKSFSQLLAGAMTSPAAASPQTLHFPTTTEEQGDAEGAGLRFRQNKPAGLVITQPQPFFAMPQGLLSPASLLESPGFSVFSPGAQGPFGMTHQQALAQVTAQAHSHMQFHAESSSTPPSSFAQVSSFTANTDQEVQPSDVSQSDQRSQPASFMVDKPANDGYNWRKYGQKQVKGSEFPRSYYKCTHPGCPVKKKVERSLDGQVTEIIYKGQHNHQPPQSNKRAKGSGSLSTTLSNQGNSESTSQLQSGNLSIIKQGTPGYSMSKKNQESSLATAERISRTSDSDEAGSDEKDEDEPDSKRRNTKIRVPEPSSSHKTVTESRIIVQTRSKVDLLDDGYRWRKYGQKVVKGNPYPRSYYKCTTPGCNVRKHVERASTNPKAVITTYEGKHTHDVPAAKTSSHNTADTNTSHGKTQDIATDNHVVNNRANNRRQPVARLRLKEEHANSLKGQLICDIVKRTGNNIGKIDSSIFFSDKRIGISKHLQCLHQNPSSVPDALRIKEQAITNLSDLLRQENRAEELRSLLTQLRPFFALIPKAKTAKIVRGIIDDVAKIPGTSDLQISLCKEVVQWTRAEKRTFLRQRVEAKLAALLMENKEYSEALNLLSGLIKEVRRLDDKLLLVDIDLLESKLHFSLQNLPKAKASLTAARTAANAIYVPPAQQGNIDLQSGILHAEEKDYKTAYSYFFEAFEAFNALEDPRAVFSLKYMLLCKIMVSQADDVAGIISSKAGLQYVGPELDAMKAVADAHAKRSLKLFEIALRDFKAQLEEDPIVHRHLSSLYDTLLEQNLCRLIEPFSRVEISHIAELIELSVDHVEKKLSQMILDKKFAGTLDQGAGCLVIFDDPKADTIYPATLETITNIGKVVDSLYVRLLCFSRFPFPLDSLLDLTKVMLWWDPCVFLSNS